MANQCSTQILLFSQEQEDISKKEAELKKIQQFLDDMGGSPTLQEIADKFGVADGDVWQDANGKKHNFKLVRGYISTVGLVPAIEHGTTTHLEICMETDYRPCVDVIDILLDRLGLVNDVRYLYCAEERGSGLYETNDLAGTIYADYAMDIQICGTDRNNPALLEFMTIDPGWVTEEFVQYLLAPLLNEPSLDVPALLDQLVDYPFKDKYSHINFFKVDRVERTIISSRYENKVRELLKEKPISYVVGCIYGLWADYEIDEEEEFYLYRIVDPNEEFNDASDYWNEIEEENPLAA